MKMPPLAPELEKEMADLPAPAQRVLQAFYEMGYAEGFLAGYRHCKQECIAIIEQEQNKRADHKAN